MMSRSFASWMNNGLSSVTKKQRYCILYIIDIKRKKFISHVFGSRNDETCRKLLDLLAPFNIRFMTTDNWGSYSREIEPENVFIFFDMDLLMANIA
ncbi:IS1 family transposase [Xenorhabdus japonica]|uniref:IS1 transposase n=1 Tax=Xenorhabdus japonica TaxID=53341 RepID=A0A1I5DTS9_9GAMM|nr:IS1 family transposase [Xenorhabdus japonica]SFO02662.1 IS1 transposase [Xenorhabdus japonica]